MIAEIFSFSNLERVKPGSLKIFSWDRATPPNYTNNLLRAIILFARFSGLASIRSATIQRLKREPAFKYCFSPLIMEYSRIYDLEDEYADGKREKLMDFIRNPYSATYSDMFTGILKYINNFFGNMPEGFYRTQKAKYIEIFPEYENSPESIRLFGLIDKILEERNILDKINQLKQSFNKVRVFGSRKGKKPPSEQETLEAIEYLLICIDVFHILVEQHGYHPKILWR